MIGDPRPLHTELKILDLALRVAAWTVGLIAVMRLTASVLASAKTWLVCSDPVTVANAI
jgi:hypothetical protein